MEQSSWTPKQIVAELNKYIVGQGDAKKSVAIALRNRWRRKRLSEEMQDEIIPKNILLIGPTGVGKTEIARRLAKLVGAPFIKVEATKYTEVGYVGRDVEQMIRDLVANAIRMVQEQESQRYEEKAEAEANKRILQVFWPKKSVVEKVRIRWTSSLAAMTTKPRKNRNSSKKAIPTAVKRCSKTFAPIRWTTAKSKSKWPNKARASRAS